MHIGLSQTVRMEQRMLQSPRMIQAMHLLQLSSMDLQERVDQELLENPLLARTDAADGEANGDASGGDEHTPADAPLAALDALLAARESDRWDPALRRRRGTVEEADRKHAAMQNAPAAHHSLGEALLDQTALIELDGRQRQMVEFLVFSLDERGYLPRSLADVTAECGIEGATELEFSILLEELRHATHPALGASDLRECLLLQVDGMPQAHPLLRKLIAEHLGDVAANRLPHVARLTGASLEDVSQTIELLRTLDPFPGSAYGAALAETIRPEVIVSELDGAFQVRLTREGVQGLTISADYTKLLHETSRGDAARQWLRKRLEAARWFVDALEQRQSTLLLVARAIFERQPEFLERGPRALAPLRMMEVADAVGLHISTVSRAVAGKYAQTPHGILPLRSFFTGGTARDTGGVTSQKVIQQRLRELVAEEDPMDPLSDDRLAELLRERDGIHLARRTITKYRKILSISCSAQRRVF